MSDLITREQKVEQSIEEFLRDQLFNVRGYPQDTVELLDSFDPARFTGSLDKNYIAVGYNFDDGGTQGELGSDLVRRLYTIELFVIAATYTWGKNLATAVRDSLEDNIPLLDISDPAKPQIDVLVHEDVMAERQPIRDPAPWQENLWLVRLRLYDEYYARLVA